MQGPSPRRRVSGVSPRLPWERARRSRTGLGVVAGVVALGLAAAVISHENPPAPDARAGMSARSQVTAPRVAPLSVRARGALARLSAAARAESGTTYAGRQYVTLSSTGSDRSAVVDLRHAVGSGYQVTVAPTMRTSGGTVVESDDAPTLVSPLDQQQLRVLAAHFTPSMAPGQRVAGRTTDVVELRDAGGRVAARYWLDRATSLPLQRIVYDTQGRVQRASAYTSITIGAGAVPAGTRVTPTPTASATAEPVAELLRARDLDTMRGSGWAIPQVVGTRGLELIDARMVHDAPPALHLRYSDGIGTLSVFEEAGHLDADGLQGWRSASRAGADVRVAPGPPEQVVWSAGGRIYTVVAEDADAVDDVIADLPHARPETGLRSRLWRGVQRVGSWVDPTR